VIDGPAALSALAEAGWDDLLARAGGRDPLRRSAVLTLPDPAGERAAVPRLVLAERGGRAVAGAALGVGRERGLVTVRHLGHAPNWFDPEPPAEDEEARAALAEALAAQPGDLLVLEELAEEGPLAGAIAGRRGDVELIPGPWTFRIATGSRRMGAAPRRREARRLARRAAERGTPVRIAATADWPAIDRQLDELLGMQARAWRDRDPDAFTGTPEGLAFVRRAVEALGREGRARLVRLDVGERLGAFHLALVWGTRAVVYKTAFDRGLAGLPGLGWSSLLALIDRLAAEGVRSIDLGPWGGAYKSHVADAEATVTLRLPLSPAGRIYLMAAAVTRGAARRRRAT
jgi:hypothetical protein